MGISAYYSLLVGQIIVVAHVATLLWLVPFPLQVQHHQVLGRFHLLHICVVVVAIVLPIGPIAGIFATGGFRPFYIFVSLPTLMQHSMHLYFHIA